MFLITVGLDGLEEYSREMSDHIDILDYVDTAIGDLGDGEYIQIRRADYLDTKVSKVVDSERPKLTLLQGGKR